MTTAHLDPALAGKRDFDYITPGGRRLTEYEAVTCYTQPSHTGGGLQPCGDFKVRPDGRPMFDPAASAIQCRDWYTYRDPNQQWQKPYYTLQSDAEKSIDRATDIALRTGAVANIAPEWISIGLLKGLFPLSYAEYGMFRALNVAARESMSDTVNNVLVFSAADKLRHAQAIAILGLDLEPAIEDLDGAAGKAVWMDDELWQPIRRLVEELMAVEDWMEIVTAVFCAYEPILAEPLRRVLLTQVAASKGDPITPTIESTVIADWLRNSAAICDLFRFLAADAEHGGANGKTMTGWADEWSGRVRPIAEKFFKGLEDELSELGLSERAAEVGRSESARVCASLVGQVQAPA